MIVMLGAERLYRLFDEPLVRGDLVGLCCKFRLIVGDDVECDIGARARCGDSAAPAMSGESTRIS